VLTGGCQMVLVLKKEVVKTNNAMEHDDAGKYRQLLVRTLHQCSVKFADVATTVIPVVRRTCFLVFVALIGFSLVCILYCCLPVTCCHLLNS